MISDFLREEINKAAGKIFPKIKADFAVSPERQFGDYSTNAGLIFAAAAGLNPREAAEMLSGELRKSKKMSGYAERIETAGPGFINFSLSGVVLEKELKGLEKSLSRGFDFLSKRKINVEFISANPTGELHIGHGRGAFYGDALANIFSFSGAKVAREYYVNDSRESKQIIELGKTALGLGEQYKTVELLELIKAEDFSGLSESEAGFKLAGEVNEKNKNFIEKDLGINFDIWYSEDKKLRASGLNEKILSVLKKKGLTYEKEGAVWLKTSEHGDDEDRVVVRSDGTFTYFLSDIAYHADKFSRGFGEVVDIWGADHHGHVKRMQAVKEMLGWKGELKIFISQLVSLKGDGATVKMSKRAGNVVLLRDLVEEFGLDVVRWFFLEKSLSTHMEFDMELARERSAKNPVFYVQYAHARINSILEKAEAVSPDKSGIGDILKEKPARALAVKIIEFPEIVAKVGMDCQINKLTVYAYELATVFSQFYDSVRVIGENSYNKGALELSIIAKDTLAKTLKLLGISAPEKM